MKLILSFFLSIVFATQTTPAFEGVVSYHISYNLPNAKKNETLPESQQKIYLKGSKSRFVQNTSVATTTILLDAKQHHATVLMEIEGQKWKFNMPQEELNILKLDKAKNYTLTPTGNKKTIAGYQCLEVELAMNDSLSHAYFYYTPLIPPRMLKGMGGFNLKGLPLEYIYQTQDIEMKISADTILAQPLPDSLFVVPPGYKAMPESMVTSLKEKF